MATPQDKAAYDKVGTELAIGDLIELPGKKKKRCRVAGIFECCGHDIVSTGSVKSPQLVKPWAEFAVACRKVKQ